MFISTGIEARRRKAAKSKQRRFNGTIGSVKALYRTRIADLEATADAKRSWGMPGDGDREEHEAARLRSRLRTLT